MTPTVSHLLVRDARREIRALRKPREVREDSWFHVVNLLVAIAGYLPDCWPSERTLAKKLGRPQQSIHRTLVRARELGLVVTTVRPLESSRDGQSYHLVCLTEALRTAISRHRIQTSVGVKRKISYSVGDHNAPPFREVLPAGLRPADQKDNVVPFNRSPDDDWSSPAIGEDPNGPLPVAAPVKVDPAVYLARRFDGKWADLLRTHPELRVTRSSSRGAAIGYLRKVMLEQVSPEHAEAYMDAFIEAAAAGDVLVKEGQFAFERFIGWWGREDIEDPAVNANNKALARGAIERYRKGLTGS